MLFRSRGLLKALSRPSVLVANGRWGTIFAGEQRFFAQQSAGRTQEVFLNSVPVGVRLDVQPWTGGGNSIRLGMFVRSSSVQRLSPEGLPDVSVREAWGNLCLGDDDLAVFGGLRLSEFERARHKIPGLGDLPLIGAAFRSTRRFRQESEIAMFVRAWVAQEGLHTDVVRGDSTGPPDADQSVIVPAAAGAPEPGALPPQALPSGEVAQHG